MSGVCERRREGRRGVTVRGLAVAAGVPAVSPAVSWCNTNQDQRCLLCVDSCSVAT